MAEIDSYTKLLLHCDGDDASTTFTDASPSAHGNASVAGNAQVDTAQKKFGTGSLLLDGTGDYLYYADHADWEMGSGEWTVDFWMRFSNTTGYQYFLYHGATSDEGISWYFFNNLLTLNISTGAGSDWEFAKTVSWTPSTDTWYHLAFVRTSNTLKIFVNGTQVGTDGDMTGITARNSAGSLYVGSHRNGIDGVKGWIEEIRISKGIARWTSNFTPPTLPYGTDAGGPRMVQFI